MSLERVQGCRRPVARQRRVEAKRARCSAWPARRRTRIEKRATAGRGNAQRTPVLYTPTHMQGIVYIRRMLTKRYVRHEWGASEPATRGSPAQRRLQGRPRTAIRAAAGFLSPVRISLFYVECGGHLWSGPVLITVFGYICVSAARSSDFADMHIGLSLVPQATSTRSVYKVCGNQIFYSLFN